jgi:hypothetical protein
MSRQRHVPFVRVYACNRAVAVFLVFVGGEIVAAGARFAPERSCRSASLLKEFTPRG